MRHRVVGGKESQEGFGRVLIVNVGVHQSERIGKNILRAHGKMRRNQTQ